MLRSLHIENMAVVRRLEFDFDGGLSVFTGETGAGKSVITDCIKFLICNKVSRDLLRTGEKRGAVSAVFSDLSAVASEKLGLMGFDVSDGEILLERVINDDGRSTCRVEGRGVSQQIMRKVGAALITVHGQHEGLRLSDELERISLLDTYVKSDDMLSAYSDAYLKWRDIKSKINTITADSAEISRRKDMLEFQVKEISAAKLKIDEEEKLLAERNRLQSAERIKKHTDAAARTLYSNEKGITASSLALHAAEVLTKIADVIPELNELSSRLRNCRYELDDISSELQNIIAAADIPSDPSKRLDEIESRLSYIGGLKRKYGTTIAEILDYAKKASEELESLDNSDERLAELMLIEKECLTALTEVAKLLSESRRKGAERIEAEVSETLRFLDMPKVRFAVSVTPKGDFAESGADDVDFLIATNSGETMKSLSSSASGGELSRVMLAIKCSVAGADDTETLIFDEVDTGVSGKTSRKIGIKLKDASTSAQIFAVTHSAQIASLAHHHLLVKKEDVMGRMETHLEVLDYDGRVNETARILGGINVSESQRLAAIDMINEGKNY